MKTSIEKLIRQEPLSDMLFQQALDEMLDPTTNQIQIAAFLVLLRAKKETATELAAIVKILQHNMLRVHTPHKVLDIVGTGGDGFNTVNISTGSAMLAASCGIKIAKHGNRSVSSLCGSADVLEALGVNIQLTATQVSASIDKIGIGFCYAPNFHPITQAIKNIRKELNVPTTFNILGPLLNPANAQHLILGVLNSQLLPIMADVLLKNGNSRSIIAHSIGLDEINCAGSSEIIEINNKEKFTYKIDPKQFGFEQCHINDLRGGNAQLNAKLLLNTFQGHRSAIADTLILNAAIALYIYGMHPSILIAIQHAKETLYNGSVLTLLKNWIEFSHD